MLLKFHSHLSKAVFKRVMLVFQFFLNNNQQLTDQTYLFSEGNLDRSELLNLNADTLDVILQTSHSLVEVSSEIGIIRIRAEKVALRNKQKINYHLTYIVVHVLYLERKPVELLLNPFAFNIEFTQ